MKSTLLPAALLLVLLQTIHTARAQNLQVTCTTTGISTLAFGTVDPQSSLTSTNATVSFSCNNPNHQSYSGVVCFGITDGLSTRQMQDTSADNLDFAIFTDPGFSSVWGANLNALTVPVTVPSDSSNWNASGTLYGQIPAGQTGAIPGVYQKLFASALTTIAVNVDHPNSPTTCAGSPTTTTGQSFSATATVANKCMVNATTLDFGAVDLLNSSAFTATSTINVQCASGVPYTVGLDQGLNGASINTRKMALGGNLVGYQLYSDAPRTLVWGNTPGSDTVAGTGNGNVRNLTVYGRVPPQATPAPGTYTDTITVTVAY